MSEHDVKTGEVIKRYIFVRGADPVELARDVNKAIDNGYEPSGPPIVHKKTFYQAMYRHQLLWKDGKWVRL